MSRRSDFTVEELARLPGERLARMLFAHATRDPLVADGCRAVLEHEPAGDAPARTILQVLLAVEQARVEDGEVPPAEVLDAVRVGIARGVASVDVRMAVRVMEEFVALVPAMFTEHAGEHVALAEVFRAAVVDWGRLWTRIPRRDVRALAALVLRHHLDNEYGARDRIITAFAHALGPDGLVALQELVAHEVSLRPPQAPGTWDRARSALARAAREIAAVGKVDPPKPRRARTVSRQ